MKTTHSTRAEIYELARVLKALGDDEGAKQVLHALIITEDAALLTAIARLEQKEQIR
jgi:hypothetical protein